MFMFCTHYKGKVWVGSSPTWNLECKAASHSSQWERAGQVASPMGFCCVFWQLPTKQGTLLPCSSDNNGLSWYFFFFSEVMFSLCEISRRQMCGYAFWWRVLRVHSEDQNQFKISLNCSSCDLSGFFHLRVASLCFKDCSLHFGWWRFDLNSRAGLQLMHLLRLSVVSCTNYFLPPATTIDSKGLESLTVSINWVLL